MACGCSKNRVTAAGTAVAEGTYRVYVNGRKVYETSNEGQATKVASQFKSATIAAPGESA